jgi:hypothetical protein
MPMHHSCSGFGAHRGESLSTDIVAAHRLPLSPPSDLLAVCRRSDRAPRLLGRRLDDPRTLVALPPIWHLRPGLCGKSTAAGRTLVFAVALRPLARNQYDTAEAVTRQADFGASVSNYRPVVWTSCSSRSEASAEPRSAALRYQSRAWVGSEWKLMIPSRLSTTGS